MGSVKSLGSHLPLGDVATAAAAFDGAVADGGFATVALAQITGVDVAFDAALMLAALSLHCRTGELDARTVGRLSSDIDAAFRLLQTQQRKSRLAPLLARRYAVNAELAARDGEPWDAAWEGWLALQAAGDEGAAAMLVPLGRRCLRLGQARSATEALLAATAADARVAPLLAAAYRLAGDGKAAKLVAKQHAASARCDAAMLRQFAWEQGSLTVAEDGRLEPLYLLARDKATPAEQLLSLSLWARAVKGRDWWERMLKPSTLRARIRDDQPDAPGLKATHAALVAIESWYDPAVALEVRLADVRRALAARQRFATVEHELLVLAALARGLARHSQPYLAAGVVQEYRNLGLRLSQGTKDDVLGIMEDMCARGLTAAETKGKAGVAPAAADEDEAERPTPTGGARRAGILAKGAAGMALTMAGTRARLLVAAASEKGRLRERETEALAATMHATLGQLRGLAMKLGQMLSIAADDLPPLVRETLGLLTESSTPMPGKIVRRLVEERLGAPLTALFAEWSDAPVAAGSIGQVHRARLADGRAVAVKVQYPGIRDAIQADLRNFRLVAPLFGWRFPAAGIGVIIDEARALLVQECDYVAELESLAEFSRLYAADPRLHLPAPVPERSCATVLTMEFAAGEGLASFARTASQADRDRIGAAIMAFMYDGMFRHSLVYGDPQPGNFKVADDGRLVVLDFGCVRRWQPARGELFKDAYRAVLGGEQAAFAAAIRALGCVVDEARFDFAAEWRYMERFALRPFLASAPFQYTRAFAADVARFTVAESPNRHAGTVPADMVITGRLSFGLNQLLALLGATGRWRELLLPLLYTRPDQWPPGREPAGD